MPMIIEYIDTIALKKGRDVLYVTFENRNSPNGKAMDDDLTGLSSNIEAHEHRNDLLAFLRANDIPYRECSGFSDSGYIIGYFGQLYIDLPIDPTDPKYQALCAYMEHPDETPRYEDMTLWAVPLSMAQDKREEARSRATEFQEDVDADDDLCSLTLRSGPVVGKKVWATDYKIRRFLRLSRAWKAATASMGASENVLKHGAYLEIIRMDEQAIPCLLWSLSDEPHLWLPALTTITGENPGGQDGPQDLAVERWLAWGWEKGYIG